MRRHWWQQFGTTAMMLVNRPTRQKGNDTMDDLHPHSQLRSADDEVVENAAPTLTAPPADAQTVIPPPDVAPIAGGITPGEVTVADFTDQSGQAPPEAAEALPTIEP